MIGCVCEYMCVCDSVHVGEYACVFIRVWYTATVGHRVSSVGSWHVFEPLRLPNWPASLKASGNLCLDRPELFPQGDSWVFGPRAGEELSDTSHPRI